MPRKKNYQLLVISFLVIILISFLPQRVFAQTPTSAPIVQAQQNPLDAIWQFLFPKIDTHLKTSLPSDAINNITEIGTSPAPVNSNTLGIEISSDNQSAGRYALESAVNTPISASTNLNNWYNSLLSKLGIANEGDKAAQNFANKWLPNGMGDTLKMDNAFSTAQCAALPAEACNNNQARWIGGPGGPGGGGTPVPTISTLPVPSGAPSPFSCPGGGLVYYSQRDPSYSGSDFDSCNVELGGCGPLALAMILSCHKSTTFTPQRVIKEFFDNEPACLTSYDRHMGILNTLGFKTEVVFNGQFIALGPDDIKDLRDNWIKRGYQLFAAADFYWGEKDDGRPIWIGHLFWITNIDESGNIYVMDSYYGWKKDYEKPERSGPYPYPMNQSSIGREIRYKTVFAFKLQ